MKSYNLCRNSLHAFSALMLIGHGANAWGATMVEFKGDTATANEAGLVPATITVTRDATVGRLEVKYRTNARPIFDHKRPYSPIEFPIEGRDFESLNGTLVFENGEREAKIELKPLPHYHFKKYRRDRTVKIDLIPTDGYTLGKTASATVVIKDDSSPKPLLSDELFFKALDYDRPELIDVKAAVERRDYAPARTALAKYYRSRPSIDRKYVVSAPNLTHVRNALNNTYNISGILHQFKDGKIDWSGLDVKDAESGHLNANWGWEFNRFSWWKALTDSYLTDPVANKASGERLVWELQDWLATSPIELEYNGLGPGTRWRALEVAIRLEGNWLRAFMLLKGTPLLSDDLLVDWVKSFYMHARYLEVSSEISTNRGAGEARALFIGGVYFPEFAESKDWVKLGLARQETILRADVLPDGVYSELSPGYLDFTLPNFEEMIQLADEKGIEISPEFRNTVMRLFEYMMYASEPNRLIPPLNDSQTLYRPMDVRIKDALKLFPERKDFLWLATDGAEGTTPTQTSRLFPDAGHVIMRSGWSRQDSYLLMDAGPLGPGGHGHEDKLAISVDGYGTRHIIDCGPYDYVDTSPYRIYSVSTLGKSAPLIDGLGQKRKGIKELDLRKSPIQWQSTPEYDYVAGYYGVDPLEGWGPDRLRPAETTRHVFFLKPDVWVVIDAFKALDDQPHTYSALFQCNDDEVKVDSSTRRVTIQLTPGEFDPMTRQDTKAEKSSMTITPLAPVGQKLSILKGQEPPSIAGWRFEKSTPWKKQAIPTARYDAEATGDVQFAYVLAAAPAGTAPRAPGIDPVQTTKGTYGVCVDIGNGKPPLTLLVALDGKTLNWMNKDYATPAMVVDEKDQSVKD